MKKTIISFFCLIAVQTLSAQQINDNNTPLHLMKPAYGVGYGVSKPEEVKQVMDRVLKYIDSETPAQLVDKHTDVPVTDYSKVTATTHLKQGSFRLTSYEWGVTYSGVLAAYQATTMSRPVTSCWRGLHLTSRRFMRRKRLSTAISVG